MKSVKLCAFAGILCVLAVLSAACGRSTLPGLGQFVTGRQQDSRAQDKPQPSEIEECDSPGALSEFLGFDIISWPDDEALSLEKVYAVDGRIAQLEYTAPGGSVLVLRAAFANTAGLAGTYHEGYGAPEITARGGVDVEVSRGEAGSTMAVWRRGDFQYVLHCNARYAQPADAEIFAFVDTIDAA